MYVTLKYLHVSLAIISIAGFVFRGYWMMQRSPWLQRKVTRVAPHIVDTIFLLSGIALILWLNLPVLQQPWLLAKFIALLVYIVLGAVALRRGPTIRVRLIAFGGALLTYAYIAGAALTKSAQSWFVYL